MSTVSTKKMSSLSKRAAPGGPGARPSPYGFPGRSLWRARPGRTEEMTVPLGTVNDMRSMDAAGRSRSEAARVLHVSRNTVAKYADMEDMSPAAPTPQRRGRPALEGNEEWVVGVLEADLGAPRKRRRTAWRIYDRLVAERGYAGSCSTARRFVREPRLARAATGGEGYLELEWAPGTCQVDFGNFRAAAGGRVLDPRLPVATLPHSNDPQRAALMSQRPGGRTRSPPPSWRSGRGSASRSRWSAWRLPQGGEARPRGLEARSAAQALRAIGAQDLRRPRHGQPVVGRRGLLVGPIRSTYLSALPHRKSHRYGRRLRFNDHLLSSLWRYKVLCHHILTKTVGCLERPYYHHSRHRRRHGI